MLTYQLTFSLESKIGLLVYWKADVMKRLEKYGALFS